MRSILFIFAMCSAACVMTCGLAYAIWQCQLMDQEELEALREYHQQALERKYGQENTSS